MHLSRNFKVRSTDLRILFPVCPEAGVVSQRHWAISGLNASSTVMNRFTSIWKLKNGLLELQDWNNLPVDWSNLWTFSLACKQALCMGYSEICFWIARGEGEGERAEPAMVLLQFEFCLLFHLTADLLIRVIAWLNKNSHSCPKQLKNTNNTSWHFGQNSENYCLKARPWMGTSFPNFPYMI